MAVKQHIKQNTIKKRKVSSINTLTPKITENYLNEANSDVGLAYDAFINARNELSDAVKEQEVQGKHASQNAERRYRAYRTIVEQAFNEREETERQALEAYRESIIKSGKIYRDILEAALEKCKLITDNAWEVSLDILKTNPNGEIIPTSGTWPKYKESLHNFAKQTGTRLNQAYHNTGKFVKKRLNIIKTTEAKSCRIKLK